MTYAYYQEHKEELTKAKSEQEKPLGFVRFAAMFITATRCQTTINAHFVDLVRILQKQS